MGSFVREAFRVSGIDEKLENVITESILQKWNSVNGNKSSHAISSSTSPQAVGFSRHQMSGSTLHAVTEQVWRRLERKYEEKLQLWKQEEEEQVSKTIENLKIEYKKNLEFAQSQFEERLKRKEEEFRRREEALKEENRLEFEKRHLELQRAWGDVEARRKDLHIEKEHLEAAKTNFALKMGNDAVLVQRQNDELSKKESLLEEREKLLEESMKDAVAEARRQERNWIVAKVKEWNLKEAKYLEKSEAFHEKLRQLSKYQSTINEHLSTIRILQADNANLRERLKEAETKLEEVRERIRKYNDYETIKEENTRLKDEMSSKARDNALSIKELELANLRKRLKLVEETADLRIKELKLRLKVCTETLHRTLSECQGNASQMEPESAKVKDRNSSGNLGKACSSSPSRDGSNSAPSGASSSFDRTIRDRLRNIDQLSRQLDVSLAAYQAKQLKCESRVVETPQPPTDEHSKGPRGLVPLMTSTPKARRKSYTQIPRDEDASRRVLFGLQNLEDAPEVSKPLQNDGLSESVLKDEEADRSSFTSDNPAYQHDERRVGVGSSGGDIDPLLRQYISIAKGKRKTSLSGQQTSAAKPLDQGMDDELVEVDPVEGERTNVDSELEW